MDAKSNEVNYTQPVRQAESGSGKNKPYIDSINYPTYVQQYKCLVWLARLLFTIILIGK